MDITVIDGEIATQLTSYVGNSMDGDPLWSSRLNATKPDDVVQAHLDFWIAGADLIRTNTYQASIEGYSQYLELTREQSIDLIKSSVGLAYQARDKFLKDVENIENRKLWIVGSIGPYGAYLHDGSEYNGNYIDSVPGDTIKEWHKGRIDAMLNSEYKLDALAVETIPSFIEAEILTDLLLETYSNVKFWISFQCKDTQTTAHNENFVNGVLKLWKQIQKSENKQNVLAIGVNCVYPEKVTPLIAPINQNLTEENKIPLIVYPNSGETYDTLTKQWIGNKSNKHISVYIEEWIKLGAIYVGGCCRNYAHDIVKIREKVDALSQKKS